jgi:hypothetical protein
VANSTTAAINYSADSPLCENASPAVLNAPKNWLRVNRIITTAKVPPRTIIIEGALIKTNAQEPNAIVVIINAQAATAQISVSKSTQSPSSTLNYYYFAQTGLLFVEAILPKAILKN